MKRFIDWLARRMYDAWTTELNSWEAHVFGNPPHVVVEDSKRWRDLGVLPKLAEIPNRPINRFDFQTEEQAEAFIERVAARAAIVHLLCFWRKL